MEFFFDKNDYKTCPFCFYRVTKPFPKICPNPNCLKLLDEPTKSATDTFADDVFAKNIQTVVEQREAFPTKIKPEKVSQIKQIQISKSRASTKIKGVRVRKKLVDLDAKILVIPTSGQYFKNFGVVTEDRVNLFNKNNDYVYLQELSCNLDDIASSIMGGEIDQLILISEASQAREKVLYIKQNGIIFFVYGMFPDKQGYWILEQMTRQLRSLNYEQSKELDKLDKVELDVLSRKFDSETKNIMKEYIKMEQVMTDEEIPSVEESLRIDYMGMSYKSIGIYSKIFGNDLEIELEMDLPPEQIEDLKLSLITAKIEAICANTIANTNAFPIYLSVKLGFEKIRYLCFEKLKNEYYSYVLLEGNLKKYNTIIERIIEMTDQVTDKPFKGDLAPYVKLKEQITEFFKIRVF